MVRKWQPDPTREMHGNATDSMISPAKPTQAQFTSRKQCFRWLGWFALANALVFALISLRYLSGYVPGETVLAWIYLVTVFIGHHVMLTTIPLFLLLGPLILIWPRRRLVTVSAIFLMALMIALTLIDSMLWSQSRFHLNGLTMKILGYQSWIFVAVMFLIGLFFESIAARNVWNWVGAAPARKGRLAGWICALCVVLSQGIHAWADASYYVPVTAASQQLPVYKGLTAKSFLTRHGLVDAAASRERQLAKRLAKSLDGPARSSLNYPVNALQCDSESHLNLLVILVDAMRSDMLAEETAPNISEFAAARAAVFSNHFSGGNSSRMGAFSLFYGLPPGYWSSFEALQRSSVWIDQLQANHFQLGIFSSQTMYRPVVLDRTAFANVADLRMATEPLSDPAWKRDRKLTDEWFEWLSARDSKQPFFGFLFYDAATVKKPPPDYQTRFKADTDDPQQQRFAQYKTAVHFDDSLIGEVLDDLQQRGLSDNTVVIISSDHGEEFDDSGAGLEKHGSGYSSFQLQTPMVVAWPGRTRGEVYSHRTSHYDIVPTLMQDLFGCRNPATDYSVGRNLFEQKSWDWMIAGSYFNYAVLEPEKITVTFPNGGVEVRDWNYRLVEKPEFNGDTLSDVAEQNTRFHAR